VQVVGRRGIGGGIARRRRRLGDDDGLGVGQLVLLLPLHAPVLEPDLDLSLGETEDVRDLDAPTPGQVAVEVELLLEFENLVLRVRRARALTVQTRHSGTAASTCTRRHHSALSSDHIKCNKTCNKT